MKTALSVFGSILSGSLILLGTNLVYCDIYASWYEDGGVFYEDSGAEIIFWPKPIRIGDTLLSWQGPFFLALGLFLAVGFYEHSSARK